MKTKAMLLSLIVGFGIIASQAITTQGELFSQNQNCTHNGKSYKEGTMREDGAVCRKGEWR